MTDQLWSIHAANRALVERQVRTWELARQQRGEKPPVKAGVEDFIAVSGEVDVGKHEIAQQLGEKLGWAVFDREVLHVMAGNDAFRDSLYETMGERDLTWFEEAVLAFRDPKFVRNDYFHQLTRTVLTIARQGNAIFLGRGATWILPRNAGLRVRLVAPVDVRLNRFQQNHPLPPAKAKSELERLDRERLEFVRQHFHRRADDPLEHDLVINRAILSVAEVVDVVLAAHQRRARSPG